MNFLELQRAGREFDEMISLGITVEREGKIYHIAGMARCQNQAEIYIIEKNEHEPAPYADRRNAHYNNRAGMKIVPAQSYFSQVSAIRIGTTNSETESITLETESACGEPFALSADYNWEKVLLFDKMQKNGWSLPEGNVFSTMDWKDIWITTLTFRTELPKLPDWEGEEIYVRFGRRSQDFLVEKPVCLTVGQETELSFTLEDGRSGICYINKVYPMDIWKDNEEKFQDPRYLEIMTKEELEKHKEEFFRGLEEDCPRGMCYLGIEYECTLEGSLVFYDRDFLEGQPKEHKGSARAMMILLKPDEAIGKHGLKQRGCVIQTPITPDRKQMEAELFRFMEMLPEREERLFP